MPLRPDLRPATAWWLGVVVTVVATVVVAAAVDASALAHAGRAAVDHPVALLGVLAVYGGAFLLRAWAWRRVVPGLGFGQALAGIHLAVGGNHVLPFRLGEALRVTSVVRRAGIDLRAATASTVTLRAADVAAVVALALLTGPAVVAELTGGWGWLLLPVAVAGLVAGGWWLRRLRIGRSDLRLPGAGVLAAALVSWVIEAVVIWQAAAWAGIELAPADAVLVTAVTIAAQTFAFAPGGFGTYEAAATAGLVALGADAGTALAAALVAHAVKTVYALLAGGVALFVPRPGFLGRLRLPRARQRRGPVPVPADAPIVLFMPAHDEADSVGAVCRRVPAQVHGRSVELIVVDDGSSDDTARLAAEAGATVVRLPENRGLGAAVRRGLAEGVARDAAVVVFCDADGEYAPEELDRMTAPILAGEADYVIGSRFAGDIHRMLPHRRLGNLVLTVWVRLLSRTPVTDGQSGYRALSARAAAAAEVIHDFNYAQVLTLDLLAKGYRYAEVPISYRFRETGDSFVRLGRYLRNVVPAVWRELNSDAYAR